MKEPPPHDPDKAFTAAALRAASALLVGRDGGVAFVLLARLFGPSNANKQSSHTYDSPSARTFVNFPCLPQLAQATKLRIGQATR